MVARELSLTLTQEASLFVARYSLFWAARSNIRNLIMRTVFPSYAQALHELSRSEPRVPVKERDVEVAVRRLRSVAQTAQRYGSTLALLVPPGLDKEGEQRLSQAAAKAGIEMLVPVPNGEFAQNLFLDGFHLTQEGARQFTARLGACLNAALPMAERKPAVDASRPGDGCK